MKEYTIDDIKVPDWETHVKNNPKMYYGDAEITPEELSKSLKYSAEILGAKETKLIAINKWFYFCSDIDWLYKSEFKIDNAVQLFKRPYPFPEAKQLNSFRTEAVLLPFTTSAYTVSLEEVISLKGALPSKEEINEHLATLGKWGRIVGYKTNA